MIWLALIVSATPAHLYHVDLARAVRATPEGQALAEQIREAREKKQGRLQVERQRLLARRARMTAEAYANRVDALNARIDAAEAELDAMQDERLAPLLARMDGLLANWNAEPAEARTVALADVALLAPRRLCDRTGRLAEAFRGDAEAAPAQIGACAVKAYARVRLAEALQANEVARARAKALRALQAERQAELDRFRQELSRLAAQARQKKDPRMAEEAAAQKAALDQRFTRYQEEIAAAERAAEVRVRAKLDAAAQAAARAHDGVVFTGAGPTTETWAPACDATAWLVATIDGADPARALPPGCAARATGAAP